MKSLICFICISSIVWFNVTHGDNKVPDDYVNTAYFQKVVPKGNTNYRIMHIDVLSDDVDQICLRVDHNPVAKCFNKE